MKTEIKSIGSRLLNRTGLIGLLRSAIATRGGLVLALHRVLPVAEMSQCYSPHLVLSEPAFASLLELLQQDYLVVPLENLLADPRGADGRPKVAITFDDGWEDNYRIAFPHLLAHQLPATIFVCTDLIGRAEALPEERFARLWKQCCSTSRKKELLADLEKWGAGDTTKAGDQTFPYWALRMKQLPLEVRLLLLEHFERRYEVSPVSTRRFMGWDDLRVMANTGLVQLGSHTSRHAALTSESDRDIRSELANSRAALAEKTGTMPSLFAYPNGMRNQRVADLVRSAGFAAAVSTDAGMATLKSDRMAIPRIAIDDTTVSDASSRLSPARTAVYFVRSGLRSGLRPALLF